MASKLAPAERIIRYAVLLLFLIPFSYTLFADISLRTVLVKEQLVYRYDPFREIVQLSRGERTIGIVLNTPFAIVDYNYIVPIDPLFRTKEGDILVPESTSVLFSQLFADSAAIEGRFNISTVIIDPGHGGRDPGTIGTHYINSRQLRLYEKDIVLDVSKQLYERLVKRYPDKKVILTRDSDVFLELEERTAIANNVSLGPNEAMIFVSIHANASLNSRASGFEVWYLPPDFRRTLIDPESVEADKRDLVPILNTLLEEEYTVEGILLAQRILDAMDRAVGDNSINRGLKEESWFVVRNARMPSVLVELGFVTNRQEAQLLADTLYLKKLVEGIYNGISEYVDSFDNSSGFTQ